MSRKCGSSSKQLIRGEGTRGRTICACHLDLSTKTIYTRSQDRDPRVYSLQLDEPTDVISSNRFNLYPLLCEEEGGAIAHPERHILAIIDFVRSAPVSLNLSDLS